MLCNNATLNSAEERLRVVGYLVQRSAASYYRVSPQQHAPQVVSGAFDPFQTSSTVVIAQPLLRQSSLPIVPFDPFKDELRSITEPRQNPHPARFTQAPLATSVRPKIVPLYPVHQDYPQKRPGTADVARSGSHIVPQATVVYPYSHHGDDHSVSKVSGGGQKSAKGFEKSHGSEEKEGYGSDHHHDIADHGKHNDEHKASHYDENGGHVDKHHDEAGHYKNHQEAEKSHKSAKFGEKKGHKRGHKTKGYHNKFHRDEYHREHRFYDDAHKEGYHEKYGKGHAKYSKDEGAHKNGGSHKSGNSEEHHGKEGVDDKGHIEDEHKGYTKEDGKKKYHKHYSDYGTTKGNTKGQEHGYSHANKE
ncbi:hypothetical protein GWI33_006126 [Rhynchophorus ferrugineus]|uniref:Uncharacterized protein n=1 Tax=Rhynchophorus ferrugineus TaxID=354439 RepID=A0A834MHL2_RHYFE|nr:hypothetical protein GWI33_006126 [Rhynchophorus ferrugineus]